MEILLLKTENVKSWEEVSGFMGCLVPARRKIVEKKANDGDKINSLLSQLLLLSELEKRTNVPMKKISFTFGKYGKPYLDNGPYFSLSHTKGAIVAAFSADGEIGIDIERKNRPVNENMYSRVLSDEERGEVKNGGDFLRCWVRKEAFLKRLGIGITQDLRGVNSSSLPDTSAIDSGDFYVGASGKGALSAVVLELPMTELLSRFVMRV